MDRHAAVAMTYMVDYVTARRLTADVAVQTLALSWVSILERHASLARMEERRSSKVLPH